MQSCRGTFGSDGSFEPLVHERDDGLDTVEWLRRQPWYGGRFGMFGVSYQGFVQWALAAEVGDEMAAMVAVVTASQTRDSTYAGESFSLDTVLTWAELLSAQTVPWWSRQVELKRGQPRLTAGLAHLPLADADRVATGATVPFFQEWLREVAPDADYWRPRVFDTRVADVAGPVLMITGWYDIFLPAQLADFAVLRDAGRSPHLRIGPWTHGGPALLGAALREGLTWFDRHLRAETPAAADPAADRRRTVRRRDPAADPAADRAAVDPPVRVHVGGPGGGWRDLADWPPPSRPVDWHLAAGGRLDAAAPGPSAPSRLRYDPTDPTPSLGGPLLVGQRAGAYDNRPLEARPDVLTFTSAPLESTCALAGPVGATVYVRSELPHFDVFVRLCDVDPAGRSENVCDGLVRVAPGRFPADADGVLAVPVPMWPVARRFAAGHRLRLQVSGGAHPRYARNPGTGEPLGSAVVLRAGGREVFHEPGRASAVTLPLAESPQI